MQRLLVNPGSLAAWEIKLKPGTISLGRGPDNDFQIDDSSVSTAHCQIITDHNQTWVKDLQSTNGTFIDHARIFEAALSPGQSLRLGNVTLLLTEEVDEPSPPSSTGGTEMSHARVVAGVVADAPPAETTVLTKPIFCKNHYQNAGRYYCPKCARHFCDLCVNTRGSSSGGLKFCKVCGTGCSRVSVQAHAPKHVDFFKAVPAAFKYPFLGDGLMMLIGGTFFFGFLDLANYVARHAFAYGVRQMMMRVVIFTFILGVGYLFSFLKNVIYSTAEGDQQLPDWPELSEWKADIVSPMFQFVVTSVLCFGPALAFSVWADGDYPWMVWTLALFGCIYFPMALLGVAMFDSLTALNPLFVLGSIARIPGPYGVAVGIFTMILAIRWGSETALAALLHWPLVPSLVADLLVLGLLIVLARVLGLLYLSQKDSLNWFRKKSPFSYRQPVEN